MNLAVNLVISYMIPLLVEFTFTCQYSLSCGAESVAVVFIACCDDVKELQPCSFYTSLSVLVELFIHVAPLTHLLDQFL